MNESPQEVDEDALPSTLIRSDGSSFAEQLAESAAGLEALTNPERVAYRDANSRAISTDAGARLLIVAGPGSGKSYLFLDRIRHWLGQYSDARIYVTSFVRKLVKDLDKEIAAKIDAGDARRVDVSTLHTLARSLLERNGGTAELPLKAHVAVMAGWSDLVWKDVLEFHPALSSGTYSRSAFEAQLNEEAVLDTPEWRELRATFDGLRVLYNAVGFADMIVSARTAVVENPSLIEHALWIVDEFQDFNASEEHLVRAVTDKASGLLIAGDDEQALYKELKSSLPEIIISYYENSEFANAMLPYSSRCSYHVCLAASKFIESNREEGAIAKIYLPLIEDPKAPKVQVVAVATPTSAVDYIRGFIEEHQAELEAHQIEMIAGEETDAFLLILTPTRGVTFYKSRGADEELHKLVDEWSDPAVSHSPDYWKVANFYAVAQNASDNFALRKVLDYEGLSVPAAHELLVQALDTKTALADVESDAVAAAIEKCQGIAAIIDADDLSPHAKADQCADLIAIDDRERLAVELDADPISKATDEGEDATETGGGASPVELLTIVGAKGLSAKHVIVLGCDDVNLAHTTPLGFYVALTRARKSLHLITAAKAGGAKSPHQFLSDLPEECCEIVVHKKTGSNERLAGMAALRDKFETWAWVARKSS